MNRLLESLRIAYDAIQANRSRAFLTTLGVVIGIAFVLLMGWMLDGLDRTLDDSLAVLGENILYVDRISWITDEDRWAMRNRPPISWDQYERAGALLEGKARFVVPMSNGSVERIRFRNLLLRDGDLAGTTSDYIEMLGGDVAEGRFFSQAESRFGSRVAVLGSEIAANLFPRINPIGQMLRLDGHPFLVVGVMPKRGTGMTGEIDEQILIPIRRFMGMYGRRRSLTIAIKPRMETPLEDFRFEIEGAMRRVRGLEPGEKNDFGINTLDAIEEQVDAIRLGVWGVGMILTGLSFLVGAIGIMNIMFVSVVERTREIGIRKSVGATRTSILQQFLIEAVLLCLMGGAVSLLIVSLIAWFGSDLAASELGFESLARTVPPSQVLLALIVAVMVGALAGIIPALRASRLDPVEALRAE